MEQHGVETPNGLVRLPPGVLTRPTTDRYLRQWGFDQMRLARGPAAVRFQARRSNELWHFDLSPSDLKHVLHPLWSEPGRGAPTLMLYSAVDDRFGYAYLEYRCVYGEDVEGALRFLFNAMSARAEDSGLVAQGIPDALYCDNGPIARSRVFQAATPGSAWTAPPTRWTPTWRARRCCCGRDCSTVTCMSSTASADMAPTPRSSLRPEPARVPFADPDPFEEIAYPSAIRAKLAIADLLGRPLARLSEEDRAWINGVLGETLAKTAVMARVRERFLAPRAPATPLGHAAATGEGSAPCRRR